MNILPKKRWHVRTKDNIARVRRDEAAAREEDRKRQEKLELAESEARINFLRRQSGLPEKSTTSNVEETTSNIPSDTIGVDLFADHRSHVKVTNKEHEKEKKEEQEKYEKQIGYLTYLGQDTNEALKLRSWYEVAPKRRNLDNKSLDEKDLKAKFAEDPLTLINALVPHEKSTPIIQTPKRATSPQKRSIEAAHSPEDSKIEQHKTKTSKKYKHKKNKKNKRNKDLDPKKTSRKSIAGELEASKEEKLDKLRRERLRREEAERARQEALFAPSEPVATENKTAPTPRVVQKYNSQFNPELAKQNMV